jgi:proteasome lid subunit RPN8/RPN11
MEQHTILSNTMTIRGIRQDLLSLLLQMGRDAHPNEFVALLMERDGVIDEVNLLPGTVAGEDSASLLYDMMPLSTHIAGSCHSHPNGVLLPSGADIRFFPRTGRFHFIIGYPYTEQDWRCFSSDGQKHRMEVV